jgi:hypothetical protein
VIAIGSANLTDHGVGRPRLGHLPDLIKQAGEAAGRARTAELPAVPMVDASPAEIR